VSDNIKVVILTETETVACLKAVTIVICGDVGHFGDVWFKALVHDLIFSTKRRSGNRERAPCPGFVKEIICQRQLPPHSEAQCVFCSTHAQGTGDVEQGYQEDLANPYPSSTCGDRETRKTRQNDAWVILRGLLGGMTPTLWRNVLCSLISDGLSLVTIISRRWMSSQCILGMRNKQEKW